GAGHPGRNASPLLVGGARGHSTPTRGMLGVRCANAGFPTMNGHATAAPPIRPMNCRRLMATPGIMRASSEEYHVVNTESALSQKRTFAIAMFPIQRQTRS